MTQEQFAERAGLGLKFYQKIEAGRKTALMVETIERLAKPYRLESWHLLAPLSVIQRARPRMPKAKHQHQLGPRAKWPGSQKRGARRK